MSNVDEAYRFYSRHIYDEEKIRLLEKYNLQIVGSVPPVLWELFGALLTGRSGAGATGAGLIGWEVKSARQGGSYEYQYHLNTGAEKLKEDREVNHLFCAYSETYKNVSVRVIKGLDLSASFFDIWEPEYHLNYDSSAPSAQRRQRFRKNIPFGYVETNGVLVLKIEEGLLAQKYDDVIVEMNGK